MPTKYSHLSFSCPHCAKTFRWKQAIAGRKVLCAGCGVKLRIPHQPGMVAADLSGADPTTSSDAAATTPSDGASEGGYELLLDEESTHLASSQSDTESHSPPVHVVNGKCPSCNMTLKPGALICLNCGFDLNAGMKIQTKLERMRETSKARSKSDIRQNTSAEYEVADNARGSMRAALALSGPHSRVARALEDREDAVHENSIIELWLPLGLILVGIGFSLVEALYFHQSSAMRMAGGGVAGPNAMQAIAVALLSVGIYVLIQIPLLLFAMILSVKLMGLAFGTLGRTLFKLVAVVIGPAALGGIVSYLLGGGVVGFFVGDFFVAFVLFWALVTILFDLEAMEALYLIFLLWAVKWVALILAMAVGSSIFV